MDTAKLIALMAKSGDTLADIYGVGNAKGGFWGHSVLM
jgi:hypothetical protein